MYPTKKLSPEMVPSSCWYSNLRSELSATSWNRLKEYFGERAGWKCEITGTIGRRHPVELHEHWYFNDETGVQSLVGFSMLAPKIHLTMHPGFAATMDRLDEVVNTMVFWNKKLIQGYDYKAAWQEIDDAFFIWEKRSERSWNLDLSYLENLPIEVKFKKKMLTK